MGSFPGTVNFTTAEPSDSRARIAPVKAPVACAKVAPTGSFFSGTHQAPPHLFAVNRPQEKALDLPAGGPLGEEPGGQDGGVVAEKGVPGAQKIGQVREGLVRDFFGRPVHNEQPRGVTAGSGGLRDEMRRQVIVKECGGERWHAPTEVAAPGFGEFVSLCSGSACRRIVAGPACIGGSAG
jgi:hypothetical protein